MSSPMQQQQQVEWRKAKVLELMSKGETNRSETTMVLKTLKQFLEIGLERKPIQYTENNKLINVSITGRPSLPPSSTLELY